MDVSHSNQYHDDLASFTISGVLVPTFSTIGIIGNILCLLVLSQKQMRSSTTNWYLMALSVSDSFVLISSILTVIKETFPFDSTRMRWQNWQNYPVTLDLFIIFHPFAILFQVTSIWLTVVFSLDRYFMICHPFMAQRICTVNRSKHVIVITYILSALYNIPRFFENYKHQMFLPQNVSLPNITFDHLKPIQDYNQISMIDTTPFGTSWEFKVYYHLWSWIILVILIPLVLIIYMNIYLIFEVRKSIKRLNSMGRFLPTCSEEITRIDTNVMLIGVIVIFLICQIPSAVSHILWALNFPLFIYNEIGNFLIILNSALNIVPYYFFSRRFRSGLINLLKSMLCIETQNSVTYISYRAAGPNSYKMTNQKYPNEFQDNCDNNSS